MTLQRLLLVAAVAVATLTANPTPVLAAPPPAVWPLQPHPHIVRGFEQPAKPWLPGHRGVDLAGKPGQPVLAATAGTISYAGQLASRGVVAVAAGGRRTTYEPVVPVLPVGTAVAPGTVIAHLSAAGSHCAPATCLHWGLLQGKHYLNPLTLLPNQPVRLLPLTGAPHPPLTATAPEFPGSPPPHGRSQLTDRAAASPRGERTAAAIVATTAALTLAAGVLIRRH